MVFRRPHRPEVPTSPVAFKDDEIDRGHMVRREDPNWCKDAETADSDTFHYTNAAPNIRASIRANSFGRDSKTTSHYVDTAGAVLLAPHFADRSPEYPIFSVLVTRQNRDQAAREALR